VLLIIAALILFGAGNIYAQLQIRDPLANSVIATDATTPVAATATVDDAAGADNSKTDDEVNSGVSDIVTVHVVGAVANPGVYSLPSGSRVVDAVTMAGPTSESALDYLNMAALLEDSKQIIVYSKEQVEQMQITPGETLGAVGATSTNASAAEQRGTNGLININTASQSLLEELPGIGPAMSQRIIDYRTQNGGFATIEDVQKVSGIGEKRYAQIKDLICVK